MDWKIETLGDHALVVRSLNANDRDHHKILEAFEFMKTHPLKHQKELIPSFEELLIIFEDGVELKDHLESLYNQLNQIKDATSPLVKCWRLPVCYAEPFCLDKESLRGSLKLPWQEIIEAHVSVGYKIKFNGFLPGFPYMTSVPEKIRLGRHDSPRRNVEAGSVAIALDQTGIYPFDSPGGWHVIGKCPIPMVQIENESISFSLMPGDSVEFYEISIIEFDRIRDAFKDGLNELNNYYV